MNLSVAFSTLVVSLPSVFPAPSATQVPAPSFQLPEVRGGTGTSRVKRIVHVIYDVQQDRLSTVRTASPGELALGGQPCFDNSQIIVPDDPQYVVANSGEDILNWATKRCPGADRLRKFTIAYRSEALDVTQGGPGAAFSIALYTGSAGFGQPGTEVFRRTFTGMPGYDAPESPTVLYPYPDAEPLVLVTVDFGTEPMPLSDGAFGWSFLQLDGDTGPVLVRAPRQLLGTLDAMDIYSPGPATPATYVGTFNYGGSPSANMWIQLDEIATDEVANSTTFNGTGVNPALLSEILPARIGHVWAARINATVPQIYASPYTILLTSAAASAPIASRFGEVLVDPAQFLGRPQFGEAGYSFALPPDTSLVGFRFFVQGIVLPPIASPAIRLTNALSVRVGY
jgi:hypothetical protein